MIVDLFACKNAINLRRKQTIGIYKNQALLSIIDVFADEFQELPQEAKRYSRIDKGWTKMMKRAFDTRNVLQVNDMPLFS